MLKKYLCLITICLTAASMAFAQGTFKPRDADEVQAWQIYNEYKESRRIEAPLEAAIKQKFGEAFEAAVGYGAVLGVDWDANAAAKKKVEQLAIERKRQAELLAAWEKKFYWRYGDLRWTGDKIRDAKTNREMDRIEFALTYSPFNYVPDKTIKASPTPAPVKPPSAAAAGATSLKLGYPGHWGHLSYTITGATLDAPTGSDPAGESFVGGRQYKGYLTYGTLTISGNAISDNTSGGPGSGDYYELVVSVTVGKEHKEYGYIAPKDEKLNKPFSLSVPVTPGATGSFSIRLLEQNANYGPHGWVVSGNLAARPTVTGSSDNSIDAKVTDDLLKQGSTFNIDKKYGDAVATFDRVLAIDPRNADALRQRAIAKRELKDLAGSIADFNNLIRIDPTNERAYVGRGITKERMKDVDGALADYDHVIALNPTYTLPHFYRGNIKQDRNDYQAAAADFNRIIELEPANSSAYNNRGLAKERSGDKTGAIADYEKAIALDPKNDLAKGNLAALRSTPSPAAVEKELFSNGNIYGVENGGSSPQLTFSSRTTITFIMTYHWNSGRGAPAGTIALRREDGTIFGPWSASGTAGQGGVPNANWEIRPNIVIPAGRYQVIDSDPASWAQNAQSGGKGFALIKGYAVTSSAPATTAPVVRTPVVTPPKTPARNYVTAIFENRSNEAVHIFAEGDTFGPGNKIAPGEKREVRVLVTSTGRIKFIAGRNGQVITTRFWDGDPDDTSRFPRIIFDDSRLLEPD